MLKPVKYLFCVAALAASSSYAAPTNTNYEVIEEPAMRAPEATSAAMLKLAQTAERTFAVGDYGIVLFRDEQGGDWQQAQVDTSVLLTSVDFADNQHGWAVGHHGVIIHSQDGGESWQRQLDGFDILELQKVSFEQQLNEFQTELENADEATAEELAFEIENLEYELESLAFALESEGPTRPLLSVLAFNKNEVLVAAAYGQMLKTSDGGATWQLISERLDNERGYHYNAFSYDGTYTYIAAESGTFYRSPDRGESWEQIDFPYNGSLFGTHIDNNSRLWVYGLRGHVFYSDDQGESFTRSMSGTRVNLSGSTLSENGNTLVVGHSGVITMFNQNGQLIKLMEHASGDVLTDIVAHDDGTYTLVGQGGVLTFSAPTLPVDGMPTTAAKQAPAPTAAQGQE
ncbi:MAG: YCF48-related protein [Idiomarina sp.]